MDNKKKRGLYGQKSRREIQSEPNIERPIPSSDNSEDFPSEIVNKCNSSTENIKNNILEANSMSTLADQADKKTPLKWKNLL